MSAHTLRFLLPLFLVVYSATSAGALIKYSYTGNPYDFFLTPETETVPGAYEELHGSSDNPYVGLTEESLRAELVLNVNDADLDLLKNLSFSSSVCSANESYSLKICSDSIIESFHFSDGFYSSTLTRGVPFSYFHASFSFETDDKADIVKWAIEILGGPPDPLLMSHELGDCIYSMNDWSNCSARASIAGSWTKTAVPEPSPVLLLLLPLIMITFLRRRIA